MRVTVRYQLDRADPDQLSQLQAALVGELVGLVDNPDVHAATTGEVEITLTPPVPPGDPPRTVPAAIASAMTYIGLAATSAFDVHGHESPLTDTAVVEIRAAVAT